MSSAKALQCRLIFSNSSYRYKRNVPTLIKNKIKFSSYIRIFRREQLQVIYEEGLPNTYEEMRKYLVIFEKLLLIYDFATASV
jgi:hypothetical protein